MRKSSILMLFMLLTIISLAQNNEGRVYGVVNDGDKKNSSQPTVMLLNASDSSVVKMTVADKLGNYQFEEVKAGKYLVSASAVGHETGYSEAFELNESSISAVLKTIELSVQAKSLGGVTITSKKPFIEQKTDRMVVNVEASVTNVGANALEVLEKSPGVSVDNDGNISLKGKQGVVILIDGRPAYLSGADLAALLKNTNSSQLDQIEIMTNPPAKYDAAGNSGVINIKMKKNKQVGYNGTISLNYGQGKYSKFNESVNMNYRRNKVNLFANLSHSYRENFQNLNIQRNFRDKNSKEILSYFDQQARMRPSNKSYYAKVGADIFASDKTTIGFSVSGFNNPEKFNNDNTTLISDNMGQLSQQTLATTRINERWKNISANAYLRQVLDTAGKEITVDLDYIKYNSTRDQQLINRYFDGNGNVLKVPDTLIGNLPQHITIYSAKADYTHPLKNGDLFEAGIKTSYVETNNDAGYFNMMDGIPVTDKGNTTMFRYKENINAAYVNLNKKFSEKWSAQLGLRLENTNAQGMSNGYSYDSNTDTFYPSDTSFKRNYTQLFPTAYFTYAASKKHQFNINYGRRINRPGYSDLNPFILFLDKYTYQQGNPNLKPQFSHNIELRHIFSNFLITTLNYSQTNDIIQEVLEQIEEENKTFVKKSNIAKQRQFGLSVNANFQVKEWWSVNIWVNGFSNKFTGIINDTTVSLNASTLQTNITNQFKFKKGWSAELSGFYHTGGLDDVFLIKPFGLMNIGISKQLFKNRASLRFNVRDVLYSQKIKGNVKYSNLDVAFQNSRDSRVFNVGFTYRFAKGKAGGNRKKAGGASEEQSRVNAGGN